MKNVNKQTTSSDEDVKGKSKKIDKKASLHEPNSHKRTIVCEFNKLLFLYSHSEKKTEIIRQKAFFLCCTEIRLHFRVVFR